MGCFLLSAVPMHFENFEFCSPRMLNKAYDRMFAAFGPQLWWPGETPFEVIVGAVLTQNTNWKNVELAIENLRDADKLSLSAIHQLPSSKLQPLIRPAGYFRVKSTRLKNVVRHIVENYGDVETMFQQDLPRLREDLLTINGVGPETADSILLYAGDKPTFVIDAYTARIAKRHGWIEPGADYDALKTFFESQVEQSVPLFNEYHALIVRVGKEFCKPTPKCENCPLQSMLPEAGVIDWKKAK